MDKLKLTEKEVEKWLDKVEPLVEQIQITDEKGEEMMENMKAYISDSKHFLGEGDLVRAFEAIVWAWAILEICTQLGIFQRPPD